MKFRRGPDDELAQGRSPCGERGLKYRGRVDLVALRQSLPVRGAWIEMALVRRG